MPLSHETPIDWAPPVAYLLSFILSEEPLRLCTIFVQISYINYLGRSISHILEYLQTSSLPNIPICNTTYQLPYLRFMTLFVDSKVSMVFASNHVSQQYHMQPPVVHIPLVYLVPLPIIPLPVYTLLKDVLVLTMLWFVSIFPSQNHNSTSNA